MSDLRSMAFSAITGKTADVRGKADGSVTGMLMAIGGPSSRSKSGINLAAAAQRLGVSQRTVQRWAAAAKAGTGQRPSSANASKLAATSRRAASTKVGRTAAAAGLRAKAAAHGVSVTIAGKQGPTFGKTEYNKRLRGGYTQDLDPEQAEAMLDAWENGGDKGFMEWASDFWGQEYSPSGVWSFSDVTSIGIDVPGGR